MAARSKVWVCGRLLAGIAGSNLARYMDVCLLWVSCVVRKGSLRQLYHSSRGVPPKVVHRSSIVKPRQWGGLGPLGIVAPRKNNYVCISILTQYKALEFIFYFIVILCCTLFCSSKAIYHHLRMTWCKWQHSSPSATGPVPQILRKPKGFAVLQEPLNRSYCERLWRIPSAPFHPIPLSHYLATYANVFEKMFPLYFLPKICV